MDERKNVLLTGGTGFVGKAVLARLVDVRHYDKIFLVIRPTRELSAAERLDEIVRRMFPVGRHAELAARLVAVSGDLTEPGMGIAADEIGRLRRDVHQILHIGASTDFGAPLDQSRRHNVEGTRHALDFAVELKTHGVFERFDYVSTAYVAGCRPGVVAEGDLERGQEFSNNYEQSKYEAEQLVHAYADRLAVAVYRPSIVVGDSRSGYTPHFKVLYWPLLVLAKNLCPFFACNKGAYLDVVPVDFVADSLVALMQRSDTVGNTFHLTAGLGNEIRIRQLLRDAYRYAGIRRRPIFSYLMFLAIWKTPLRRLCSESFWGVVELARPYFRYMRGNGVRFDASRTLATLERVGITSPKWVDYRREVLGYCVSSRWGRRPQLPEYAYYLPASARPASPVADLAESTPVLVPSWRDAVSTPT